MAIKRRRSAVRRMLASIRVRLVGAFALSLAAVILASVWAAQLITERRVDQQIDANLAQETQEMRALAGGRDPRDGSPLAGRPDRIFDVFLERNIPLRNESLITYVGGKPYLRSRQAAPYRLDQDPRLVELWSSTDRTLRGSAATPAGAVEYIAVPLLSDGRTVGVFVVAIFRDRELAEAGPALAAGAWIGFIGVIVASALAWRTAGRILTPVKRVTETAREISDTDFGRRIEVRGNNEIARLADTFNRMLDRLEHAFVAQRHFLDDAGHELRTPITVIRGHLETMPEGPAERAHVIALVINELERMARMVEGLLLIARAERPDVLDLDTVDIAALTQEVHDKTKALAERSWIVEETATGRVVADRQLLTQAIMQLAENAAKHTTDGDVIALGSRIQNEHARFWVRDTGHGVPVEEQERIFERFVRGRRSRRGEGAGLGLAIVQSIASAHHGRVELWSEPGSGSLFTIVIPVDQPIGDQA